VQKYFGCTRDDVRRLAFQLAFQNKIPNLFLIDKEAAGRHWFKRLMKRYNEKLSLRQVTGISTARATGFSKEQLEIFFDLYEKELAGDDYPLSSIFNVDETGVTKTQPFSVSSFQISLITVLCRIIFDIQAKKLSD